MEWSAPLYPGTKALIMVPYTHAVDGPRMFFWEIRENEEIPSDKEGYIRRRIHAMQCNKCRLWEVDEECFSRSDDSLPEEILALGIHFTCLIGDQS